MKFRHPPRKRVARPAPRRRRLPLSMLGLLSLRTIPGHVTDESPEAELECCEAIRVDGAFFFNRLGARTYGLRGLHYEWDVNAATGKFYFNETLSRWAYGMPNEALPDGSAFVTHAAVSSASCPNETDWVRLMDHSATATNERFELPVTCIDPHRRAIAYDHEAHRFYGDQDGDLDAEIRTGPTVGEYSHGAYHDEHLHDDL